MSIKLAPLAVLLTIAPVAPAVAGMLGFERNVVVVAPWSPYGVAPYAAPVWYPSYPPYLPYEPGAYFRPPPFFYGYGYSPEYIPGANWRDNWYDATRTKVHGYTLP